MSAREQAEELLGESQGASDRLVKATAAQGYAILALADAVERHTQQLIASTEYLSDTVARGRG